jgi:nanoRNase/pAp phosphatase (c-di-AMP/oligoRNAs hydrolase)
MADDDGRFRLVTRSDFDGVVCAALFKELDVIDHIKFAHPKDVQDGKILLGPSDITANLPYDRRVQRAFDHHLSESVRLGRMPSNYVNIPTAPSAARVVYDFYGGEDAFPNIHPDVMVAVDRADSAQFTMDEVLNPSGWSLLNFLMDARTGLGRFRDFRVSNHQIMHYLIDCVRVLPIEAIVKLPDIEERVALYNEHREAFEAQIRRCSKVFGNLVVLDLREEETIYCGNRFMLYALYPETNISFHVIWGLKQQNTVFAIGKSIFNRTSTTNIGNLALTYGGGGHEAAGTCQVPNEDAERVQKELIEKINADG